MKNLLLSAALVLAPAAALAQDNPAATKFLSNWDLNGDGTVTVAEAVEMRGSVFLSFDADDNGTLDAEEHEVFDDARANDILEVPEGPARELIRMVANGMSREANDADGDGTVTAAEFEAGAAAWLAKVDRTGDGVVTAADF